MAKAKKRTKAPAMAKRSNYEVPPPLGYRFRCEDCEGMHTLVPAGNNKPDYEDWRFYYCGPRMKLACLNGFSFCELEPWEEDT